MAIRGTTQLQNLTPSRMFDQDALFMGTDLDVGQVYDGIDANAAMWKTDFQAGGSVNVPVHVYGVDIADRDLGFFNGQTQPAIAVVDVARTSWVKLSFQAAGEPAISIGGSATTLYLPNIQATQVTILAAENFLYLTESDQTDPAGRWRFRVNGDVLYLEHALTASWVTDLDILSVTSYGTISFDKTLAATVSHAAAITGLSARFTDLATLVTGKTVRGGYFQWIVQSTTPSNPTVTIEGVQGCATSGVADEGFTLRGGHFRTDIDTDLAATATARTSVGCEISARAAYSGAGTLVTAEAGTAFVGARIWMAPYFTDASIGNVNNFHALWILNEAADKVITNAIKIDSTTYGSGFTYCFNTDSGKFFQQLDGNVAGSGLEATDSSAAGSDIMFVRAEDYRTLTSSQVYRAGYLRYNIRSTTISNPTAEVTGVEGVVGWYKNPTDNSTTIRGGHFRTYMPTGNRVRTTVGIDISPRAGEVTDDCVADVGTGFIGARIWLAPFFTSASIGNINNFHGLLIINEAASRFVTNAIKIDATTYNSGFTYCFDTDSGKFRMVLNGAEAGSGLVAGETVTTAGDNWLHVRVSDYRTLSGPDLTYNAGYFRYDVRATTPGAPQCEVNGIEAVGSTYVADGNLLSLRGALLRSYIQPGSTASAKTSIGAEISARASFAPAGGANDCVALSGTCFTGARIYMAPYFTAGTLANINNFWGLWIFGEHATQRNGDAAIYVSHAGGGFTNTLQTSGAMTLCAGAAMNFVTNDLTTYYLTLNGLVVNDDDKSWLKLGGYDNPIVNTTKQTDNMFLASFHVQSQVNADSAMWLAANYVKTSVTTAAQGNMSVVGSMVRMDIQRAVAAAYGIQSHVKFTAGSGQDASSEVIAISAQTYGTCAVGTGLHWGVKSDLRAVNTPAARGTSAAFFGVTTVSAGDIAYLENLSGATVQDGLYIHNVGTMTNAIYISGTVTASIASPQAITLMPSGDVDDYFTFSTVSDIPTITATGAAYLAFGSDIAVDMIDIEADAGAINLVNLPIVTAADNTVESYAFCVGGTAVLTVGGLSDGAAGMDTPSVTIAGFLTMGTNYIEVTEMSAPGAGAANTARIYAVVGGDTLTDLAAVFQDGTVAIFAQEATDPDSPIFQFPDNTELKMTMRKPDRRTVQFVATFPDGREFVMSELRYPEARWN